MTHIMLKIQSFLPICNMQRRQRLEFFAQLEIEVQSPLVTTAICRFNSPCNKRFARKLKSLFCPRSAHVHQIFDSIICHVGKHKKQMSKVCILESQRKYKQPIKNSNSKMPVNSGPVYHIAQLENIDALTSLPNPNLQTTTR